MEKSTTDSKSLSYAVRDGVYFSLMTGFGETYISPFAIFLKSTNYQIGLLASIPQLLGAFVQLLSVSILNQLKDRRIVILFGVITQALMWIPIFLLPLLFTSYAAYFLIVGVTAYFSFGHLATPPWNSLMGDIVP